MDANILGERIRSVRERRGMSQHDLARASGVGRSQIARAETGRGMMSIPHIRALARALGTSVDYLVGTFEDIDREPAVAFAVRR
jgi:XRE family transcriptional regulator, fatty acid utilization regulator